MPSKSPLSLSDICEELGTNPQFLKNLSRDSHSLYTTYDRPKRRGGVRTISVPHEKLKTTQRLILNRMLCKQELPQYVHGCVKGRSIVTNAMEHVNKPLVLNIDLKNFFNTVSFETVRKIFKENFHCDDEAAETFAQISTYGNFLPQGAPTSPTLANIAALELDKAVIKVLEDNFPLLDFSYTRYVDDITISGGKEMVLILADIYRAIEQNGFHANPKKISIARPCARQKVTGVVVNKKLNAPKKLIRKLRQQIHYCKKYGIDDHCQKIGVRPYLFVQQMEGLIGHLRMIRPELADEFHVVFRHTSFLLGTTATNPIQDEQSKLLMLLDAIEKEKTVSFTYEQDRFKAAPANISVDENGFQILRAFQLRPSQAWRIFDVRAIESLEIVE